MPAVCLYLEAHQPPRLRPYNFFEIGHSPFYLDDARNREISHRVDLRCYRPTLAILRQLQRDLGKDFRFTISLTGVFVEQLKQWAPDTMDAFGALAAAGGVEILAETYYHSLAALVSPGEFRAQVEEHSAMVEREFGLKPTALRNTELLWCSEFARQAANMGFPVTIAEGADQLLGWRSANYVYSVEGLPGARVMLRNYRLSDDIAFRFSQKDWAEYPLTAARFAGWLHANSGAADCLNLFMDMETFGEHQWADSGIFEFLRALPALTLKNPVFRFRTISEAAAELPAVGEVSAQHWSSWADNERDASAWLGCSMQREAVRALYDLESAVKASGDPSLLRAFRLLQVADLFYYMSIKKRDDGRVHSYFRPYPTAYDAYIYFMNILHDFRQRVGQVAGSSTAALGEKNTPRPGDPLFV
ncbi:MAG: glycoside hydrolase family 57 protein [Leptospirales bacterium]|nr:glycoside hydrolase family 57 protein [Leptospirales bacterium]